MESRRTRKRSEETWCEKLVDSSGPLDVQVDSLIQLKTSLMTTPIGSHLHEPYSYVEPEPDEITGSD